jgi:hypothetical protein
VMHACISQEKEQRARKDKRETESKVPESKGKVVDRKVPENKGKVVDQMTEMIWQDFETLRERTQIPAHYSKLLLTNLVSRLLARRCRLRKEPCILCIDKRETPRRSASRD